tara:strand:- start:949 stop:1791 length:843 start_codon:yes stop_codon:yes gene_type:complete
LDLTEQFAVKKFFTECQPEAIILCAAKVGGIIANQQLPADFIGQNLLIQSNVISTACETGIESLIFLGSSCIYPKDCPQPIKEEYLLAGPLEPSNRPYAVAKISGIEQCWASNRQHGTRYIALMPCNLYGRNDNYHPKYSHVIPGLIRRFHEAMISKKNDVMAWGTGTPLREFLFCDDLAEACIHLLTQSESQVESIFQDNSPPLINIGSEQEISIANLASVVADIVGYRGSISWNPEQPDGTPRKVMSTKLISGLGWHPTTSLHDGLRITYQDFLQHHA